MSSGASSAAALVAEDCVTVATPHVVDLLSPLREELLVITGGTGFMGTWLTELVGHLNDRHGFNTRVRLLAHRVDAFRSQAAYLAARADVEVEERDVRDLFELPPDTGWLVHAAGTPDNRLHATDPVRTFQTLVHGTDAVLRAAGRLERLRRVLHVSSGQVYGSQPLDLEGVPEDFRGAAPFDSIAATYPEAKRAGETLVAAYRSLHRLNVVTVRPFAFVGPHQPLGAPWAINNFLQDALHGGPIRILGNAATVRSYLYAADMAVWTLAALVRGRTGSVYNLGSEVPVPLRRLAERIAFHAGGGVAVTEGGAGQRDREPSRFVPDTTAARTQLGIAEAFDLDTAIRRTLAWHRAMGAGNGAGDGALRPARAVGNPE